MPTNEETIRLIKAKIARLDARTERLQDQVALLTLRGSRKPVRRVKTQFPETVRALDALAVAAARKGKGGA